MDSLTHIALGSCIGELFLGKKIGKKAMLYGAIAASIPDIDFVAAFWMSPTDNLLTHRGFTHSILFALLIMLLLSFLCKKRHVADNVPMNVWMLFLGTAVFSHLFLDSLNAYGIGWFEPFNHYRVSFNIIFVADPFFSIYPGIAAVLLLILKRNHRKRIGYAKWALVLSSAYLLYCGFNKMQIERDVKNDLVQQRMVYKRYFTTPTPLNNWLWYVVIENDSGYEVGYRSVFDKKETIRLNYFPRNAALLKPFDGSKELDNLMRFSKGYYTAELWKDKVVFNDIRFGQMAGWQDFNSHFVFHYYLPDADENRLVVQRGRFANWNWTVVRSFIERIRGD